MQTRFRLTPSSTYNPHHPYTHIEFTTQNNFRHHEDDINLVFDIGAMHSGSSI